MAGVCPTTGRYVGTDLLDVRERLGLNDGSLGYWLLEDASLIRLRRQHFRAAADFARDGDLARGRREWFMGQEVRAHQLMRFRLRMRYGAVDDHVGTSTYDCYVRHDEAPSYALALYLDFTNDRLGRRHALTWPTQRKAS